MVLVDTSAEFVAFAKQEAKITHIPYRPLVPQFSAGGVAFIGATNSGDHPGIPKMYLDLSIDDNPYLSTHNVLASQIQEFLNFDGPIDDSFITAKLIIAAREFAHAVCP